MNSKDLLNQLLGGSSAGAAASGFLGGGLAGLMTSRKGRKGLRKAATYGGLAALGVMAYQAWQRSQQATAGARGPGGSTPGASSPIGGTTDAGRSAGPGVDGAAATAGPAGITEADARAATAAHFLPAPDDEQGADDLTAHLLAAMISAARADGVLDAEEQQHIHSELQQAELTTEEKARLLDLMNRPADPHAIAGLARSKEEGAELYLASVLAIEPDHWAEQAYLRELRRALDLDERLAGELEATAAARG